MLRYFEYTTVIFYIIDFYTLYCVRGLSSELPSNDTFYTLIAPVAAYIIEVYILIIYFMEVMDLRLILFYPAFQEFSCILTFVSVNFIFMFA